MVASGDKNETTGKKGRWALHWIPFCPYWSLYRAHACMCAKLLQSCLTFWEYPMDCSLPHMLNLFKRNELWKSGFMRAESQFGISRLILSTPLPQSAFLCLISTYDWGTFDFPYKLQSLLKDCFYISKLSCHTYNWSQGFTQSGPSSYGYDRKTIK